jgi:serine/threonine protein kinase
MGAGASVQPGAEPLGGGPLPPPATAALEELGKLSGLTRDETIRLSTEELEGLLERHEIKKRALFKRAEEVGIDEGVLEAADEADNPKRAILELIRKAAQTEAGTAAAAGTRSGQDTDDRFEHIRAIHGALVRLVRHKASDDLRVAKTFSDKSAFERELEILKACKDAKGKQVVIQQKDVHPESRTIYLEYAAGGSLMDKISKHPGGMTPNEAKPWVEKALRALQYLHTFQNLAHTDFKAENMLIYGEDRDQLRICDMESAAKFGEPRTVRTATPYTCAPEVAGHIVAGGNGLTVDPKEDIWAMGVTLLYMLTGHRPFQPGDTKELDAKLAPLASLTEEDVKHVLRDTRKVKSDSQLEAFLLRCLDITVANRATANKLLTGGWIGDDYTTQQGREDRKDGGWRHEVAAKLDAVVEGHEDIKEGQADIKKNIQMIQQSMKDISTSIERLRRTVVNLNLDQSPVPLVFVVELQPTEDEEFVRAVKQKDTAALIEQSGSIIGRLKRMFSAKDRLENVQTAVDELVGVSNRQMTLRLVCQYTMEPVGDGYPIHAPRELLPKMLPAL